MNYSEKDIENELMEGDVLYDLGYTPLYNQVKTEFGVIDILALNNKTNNLTVIELKKEKVDESAVGQILRYMVTVKDLLNHKKETGEELWQNIAGVEGLLIGEDCSPGVEQILREIRSIDFLYHHAQLKLEPEPLYPHRNKSSVERDIEWIETNTDIIACIWHYFDRIANKEITKEQGSGE